MATATRKRTLGRQVAIVGAGLSQFGAFPDKDSRDLFVEAFQDMMETMDKPFDIDDIECAYIGNYSSDLFETQGHTAPIVADWLGMTPIPITRIENACASSGSALREGVMAIASGMYDIVLVGRHGEDDQPAHRGRNRRPGLRRRRPLRGSRRPHLPRHLRGHRQGPHGPLRDQP